MSTSSTSSARPRRRIFVTVGTTKFNALIRTVHSAEFAAAAAAAGFDAVRIQIGRGEYEPTGSPHDAVAYDHYRLKPVSGFQADLLEAALVIGHAGAGTILEALRARVPLIVVINEDLMDNHQTEVADALADGGHLFKSTVATLIETLRAAKLDEVVPYPAQNKALFPRLVDEEMGFVVAADAGAASAKGGKSGDAKKKQKRR